MLVIFYQSIKNTNKYSPTILEMHSKETIDHSYIELCPVSHLSHQLSVLAFKMEAKIPADIQLMH